MCRRGGGENTTREWRDALGSHCVASVKFPLIESPDKSRNRTCGFSTEFHFNGSGVYRELNDVHFNYISRTVNAVMPNRYATIHGSGK
jgi:hypothetical protein